MLRLPLLTVLLPRLQVLATGLSALYSSLPHKVRPEGHEDWYRIEKEHYMHMPDVQMIINCLEFCNAVVQVCLAIIISLYAQVCEQTSNSLYHINRAKPSMENSAIARLQDILRVWEPADPRNMLKRDSWFHKTENGAQL